MILLVGFHPLLHLALFLIGHTVEAFGEKVVDGSVHGFFNGRKGLVDRTRMAEGCILSVRILCHTQLLNPFVDRNGQYIDGNAARADAHTGYGGFNFPLGLGINRKIVVCRQHTLIQNRTDAVIKGAHIHANADPGQ